MQYDFQIALAGGIYVIVYDTRSKQQRILSGHRHSVSWLDRNNNGQLLGMTISIYCSIINRSVYQEIKYSHFKNDHSKHPVSSIFKKFLILHDISKSIAIRF
jgi:hypothetical protein